MSYVLCIVMCIVHRASIIIAQSFYYNLQVEAWAKNYTAGGGSTSGQTYQLFNKMRQERPSGRTTRRQNLQFLHIMCKPKLYVMHS